MNPKVAPQFAQLCERMRVFPWLCHVGSRVELALPFDYRCLSDARDARDAIEQSDWEDWTLERVNDLTTFLHARFRDRYAGQWNHVVRIAKAFLADAVEPRLIPALAGTFPGSTIAIDAVRWDLLSALMEAAYADCQPTPFFTHLMAVYEAGHLPVGWDASGNGALLVY